MFNATDFRAIYESFGVVQEQRRKKLKKIWGTILFGSTAIIVILIILFPGQFSKGETAWILPTYGGMVFLTGLIGYLVSLNFVSEKPFFENLFPAIYTKINQSEGLYLEYTAFDKTSREFNKEGGLFTRYASVQVRRRVVGRSDESMPFEIYDTTLTTSNGKSQQVHFDGVYFKIEKPLNTTVQIRVKGSPKYKGIKMIRQEEEQNIRVYKLEGEYISNLDRMLQSYVERLAEDPNLRNVALSVMDNEIHLALHYKKQLKRKTKNFTNEVLNNYYTMFLDEIKLVNELSNIGEF